jgi:hypothetical protein
MFTKFLDGKNVTLRFKNANPKAKTKKSLTKPQSQNKKEPYRHTRLKV